MNRRASKLFRRGQRTTPGTQPVGVADALEHARALDRPIRAISALVRRTLPGGPVKDALHGVPLGHPAHPVLSDLPMGFWTSAAALDLFEEAEPAARLLIAAGLVSAVPTALTGITDWSELHRGQQRVGLVHASATASATMLYAASLLARQRDRQGLGRSLGYAGLTMLLAGGYLGRHLAFRQSAGANHADRIAHLVPLGWHDLCEVGELPDGWPVHRRLGYISLFVLRDNDEYHVLADRCSHLAGPLHQGRIVADESDEVCVVCPWHGSTFRVRDGSVLHGPATARQPAFETRVVGEGMLQVRPIA